MGLSTQSISQSKTTILIGKVQTWQKCKNVIMSLKDEKGEIMVREKPPNHNITLPAFSNPLPPHHTQKLRPPRGIDVFFLVVVVLN
jgi:hypothetical protein